jgi:hypothetical protein
LPALFLLILRWTSLSSGASFESSRLGSGFDAWLLAVRPLRHVLQSCRGQGFCA